MTFALLFHRLIVRPLRTEPARTVLTALAVALGVAVVLAIEMAGEAAAGSFRASMETLAGNADYEVTASGGIPPEALQSIALLPHPIRLRPRIESYAAINGRTVPLIGVDVLNEHSAVTAPAQEPAAEDIVWVGPDLGIAAGSRVRLLIHDREREYRVGGVLSGDASDAVVMDLGAATRALRRDGSLDRILLNAPPQAEQELRSALPPGVELQPYGARTAENRRMLEAFRWNLRVLSYIALIVGAFLIYNTISVSVVRRRNEIGIVRALGATRGAVLIAFLSEAALFGITGGLTGTVLGRLFAEGAVGAVAATVESLYVSSTPAPIALTPAMTLFGILLATLVAVLSALSPAWEASRVSPVEAMSRGRVEHIARLRTWRGLAGAAALAVAAYIAAQQPPIAGKPVFGYFAALAMLGALALSVPALVGTLTAVNGKLTARVFGVEALLATRSLAASRRRTSVLAGALATAIAMTAAVGIMVGSFRQTVLLWMEDRLQADLYIRPAGPAAADRSPTLDAAVLELLRNAPGVEAVDSFRAYDITWNGRRTTFAGTDAASVARHGRRAFLSGADPHDVFRRLRKEPDTVIVSEPFSNKHEVRAGDVIDVPLAGHTPSFRVLDVYYDYSSERGYILADRQTMLRYLPDPAPSSVAVYLDPNVSLESGRQAVTEALAGHSVFVFTNRSLREEAIRIFDRTFAITWALEAVAIIVAVMGVAGALLALVIDRRRELGLLRVLGGAKHQIRRLILFEAGVLGLLANVAGLGLGILLSLLLIFVINKQSFGWTIQFHWPVGVLIGALSLVYAATIMAALLPARVAVRLDPIEVLHEE